MNINKVSDTVIAMMDSMFDGRFFRVGNPYTGAVWGTVGTFNEANDELIRDESCGNAGNGCDIIEVNADGKPLKKPMAA